MSCGWCAIDVQDLARGGTTELALLGGNPASEMQISQSDVRAGRSGLNRLKKAFAGGVVEKRLKVQVTPLAGLRKDLKYHITMMPSTCLVHSNLLHFVSAFMNYKARKLLEEQASGGGVFKKPAGDAVISCFPMVMDCPDIVENLAVIWRDDVEPEMRKGGRDMDVHWLIGRMKDYVCRLYSILYSEHFKANRLQAPTYTACADKRAHEERIRLIDSALRYGQNNPIKPKNAKFDAPSEMTTF